MIYKRLQKGEKIELPFGIYTVKEDVAWFQLIIDAKDNSLHRDCWARVNDHIEMALEIGYQYAKR